MNVREMEENDVIQELIRTLEVHLQEGTDGSGKPLNEVRRTAMNELLADLRDKLIASEA